MSSSDCQGKEDCEFCNKQGLAVLPVRYALADQDSSAPAPAFSGAAQSTAIALGDARYTTRILRRGFLYVYDEARSQWSGYYITGGGYLFKFDPELPLPALDDIEFSCQRKGNAALACCVAIEDAAHATKVWFGFSDVPWTDRVLKEHDKPEERKKHMRCLNMAAWLARAEQQHALPVSQIDNVAEYALDAGQAATQFAFSGAPFHAKADVAQERAETINSIYPDFGLMLALDDPTGIAQDLGELMQARLAHFMTRKNNDWGWQVATMGGIDVIKHVVEHQAIAVHPGPKRGEMERISERLAQALARLDDLTDPQRGVPASEWHLRDLRQYIEWAKPRIRTLSPSVPAEDKRVKQQAWQAYTEQFDESAYRTFKSTFQDKLKRFEGDHIIPLARAHAAWMQSALMAAAFVHNFDSRDAGSGILYERVFLSCVQNTSDKKACIELYDQ